MWTPLIISPKEPQGSTDGFRTLVTLL